MHTLRVYPDKSSTKISTEGKLNEVNFGDNII